MIDLHIDSIEVIDNIIKELSLIDKKLLKNEINVLNFYFGTGFIQLSTLAILSNWIKLKKEQDFKFDIKCNIIDDKSVTYVARMNFFKLIGYEYKENFNRHSENGRFLPIRFFDYYDTGLIKEIVEIFVNKFNFVEDDPILYMLDFSLNEIIENIDRHSETKNSSTIVVQSYPKKNYIYICLIDNGIGIPNALRKTNEYKHWDDEECIKKSTEKNIRTEGTKNEGQGNGLYVMKKFIKACEGRVSIYSKGSCYMYNPSEGIDITKTLEGNWDGTIIELTININKNVCINDLMELPDYEPYSPTIDCLFS